MEALQAAMRELLQRNKKNTQTKIDITKQQQVKNKNLNEAVENKRSKFNKLTDLWDQVYCTLVDVGENEMFDICNDGKKGKYNYDQITTRYTDSALGNDTISVIYNKELINKPETIFFAEAKRVAKKYSLKTSITEKDDNVYFNIFVPHGEPVYFDLIPAQYREKIAKENGEVFDDLSTSPAYVGILSIEKPIAVDEVNKQDSLLEDFAPVLPVNTLSENEILEFIDSVPKATKDRGPASLTFTVGFVTPVDTASRFKETGRDHINRETKEPYPTVQIVKCSEISGIYLEKYRDSKKTIAHNKQMQAYRENPEYEVEPKAEVPFWLEAVPEHRGLFRSKSNGELVLVPLVAKNSRTKTKYFISIDGEELRETTKAEILPFLTPAKQLELTGGKEKELKFGPDGKEIVAAAQPLNFYLKKIYKLGNIGQSIF